jgi:hypothetical protein
MLLTSGNYVVEHTIGGQLYFGQDIRLCVCTSSSFKWTHSLIYVMVPHNVTTHKTTATTIILTSNGNSERGGVLGQRLHYQESDVLWSTCAWILLCKPVCMKNDFTVHVSLNKWWSLTSSRMLCCVTWQILYIPMFRRNWLPTSSGYKGEPYRKNCARCRKMEGMN